MFSKKALKAFPIGFIIGSVTKISITFFSNKAKKFSNFNASLRKKPNLVTRLLKKPVVTSMVKKSAILKNLYKSSTITPGIVALNSSTVVLFLIANRQELHYGALG